MADDDTDDSQKTEEPTPKRLREAREKGEVTRSQEVNHWFMILALTGTIAMLAPIFLGQIGRALLPFIEQPDKIVLSGDSGRLVLANLLWQVGKALALPLAASIVAAIAAAALQGGIVVSAESLKPKLEKLSPLSGAKRLFGQRALVEFGKGLLKISLVGAIIAMLVLPRWQSYLHLPELSMDELLLLLRHEALRVLIGVLSAMTVIAGGDYLFQRFKMMQKLRMSRQEIKDEMRQSEGDPMVKGRLRQLRQERARQRMVAAVPGADVVVTNPTHFAVALRYDGEVMNAPTVVAKGVDFLAQKIREVAKENDVPIVENRPLARALYDGVEVDQEVPPAHYKAVAEVIGYVMRLRGKLPPRK
ncbi:flagellar biosynthetic protein FlhB [Tistlia consotensis]|uniref:Flagellar biosynthetic protein FlhB n=1 Tax=Tistlia consotensis USBA 355 TaxID=560819 RepID=A0A1Y6CJA8_9PROT|nr:flagellar biosynthesis protein FlhB [Tistlia consotensis]SMF68178.1 flagellar biosynthetic protein FlhB [Tistlia consotensis USBA 355]SNR98871.1 flagellar biosynthetic protein FlhB [Tistlia consotensis]